MKGLSRVKKKDAFSSQDTENQPFRFSGTPGIYTCMYVAIFFFFIDVNGFNGFNGFNTLIGCGGAVVCWCVHLTLAMRVRVGIPPTPGTFVLQQDTLSTLLLSTHVYKWVPGRMRTLICRLIWCALIKWCLARMLPRELRRCTLSAGLILNPMTGGNNTL